VGRDPVRTAERRGRGAVGTTAPDRPDGHRPVLHAMGPDIDEHRVPRQRPAGTRDGRDRDATTARRTTWRSVAAVRSICRGRPTDGSCWSTSARRSSASPASTSRCAASTINPAGSKRRSGSPTDERCTTASTGPSKSSSSPTESAPRARHLHRQRRVRREPGRQPRRLPDRWLGLARRPVRATASMADVRHWSPITGVPAFFWSPSGNAPAAADGEGGRVVAGRAVGRVVGRPVSSRTSPYQPSQTFGSRVPAVLRSIRASVHAVGAGRQRVRVRRRDRRHAGVYVQPADGGAPTRVSDGEFVLWSPPERRTSAN
jgi:hypothetical protein